MNVNGFGYGAGFAGMAGMGRNPNADPSERIAARIEKLDADGDGALSAEESKASEKVFSLIDADGDGLLTQEEMLAAGPPPGMQGMGKPPKDVSPEEAAAHRIEKLDSDGDGALSASESRAPEEVFDAIDTNQDGIVSQAELEAAMVTIKQAMETSDLGRGPGAVRAAGGIAAYREEMNRIILEALGGSEAEEDSAETLAVTGETGAINVTA
jgi:Ca2+-binding EF-hand superfamily protein